MVREASRDSSHISHSVLFWLPPSASVMTMECCLHRLRVRFTSRPPSSNLDICNKRSAPYSVQSKAVQAEQKFRRNMSFSMLARWSRQSRYSRLERNLINSFENSLRIVPHRRAVTSD